jgi:hypothetical protein
MAGDAQAAAVAQASGAQNQLEQQQQQHQEALPSLLDLLSVHGARLTTAAQMLWAQVTPCACTAQNLQVQQVLMQLADAQLRDMILNRSTARSCLLFISCRFAQWYK